MADISVASALPLITVPNVELMHVGQWPISTGIANFTAGDLTNAVAALACPAVRRPVLKLGHSEPDPDENGMRWDGEPAIGYIANMATVEAGRTLVGDYAGMPGWLTPEVLASAYPDRSIEGHYDFRCQIGHTHPFVLTAVALLGVTPPGIGTLQSLQDVAALYGVAAAADSPIGEPVTITVHAAREDRVPNPNPDQVAAGVTSDDIRRAFYSSDYGRGWDIWICEMQIGPDLQLIVTDDATGAMSRVPITVGEGDGEEAVGFGEPVKVVVRYEDATTSVAATAGQPEPIRYASRAESRPGEAPAAAVQLDNGGTIPALNTTGSDQVLTASQWAALAAQAAASQDAPAEPAQDSPAEPEPEISSPAPVAEVPSPTTTEGAGMDPAKLREALGLLPEASDEEVGAAIAASGLAPQPEPTIEPEPAPVAPVLPEGIVTIDETVLEDLRQRAEQGVAARAQQLADVRTQVLGSAVKAGKIPPARLDHYGKLYDLDPEGTRQALASLPDGLVPLADAGTAGPAEEAAESFADVDRLFSAPVPTRQGA